jgi:hypothetical protein
MNNGIDTDDDDSSHASEAEGSESKPAASDDDAEESTAGLEDEEDGEKVDQETIEGTVQAPVVPEDEKPQRRRSSLLVRLGSNLNDEKMDIKDAGLRSQLSRLNGLMKLDMNKPRQRTRFFQQVTELVQKNPKLALCRFKVDDCEEPLLHQVVCRQPPLELVEQMYAYNPMAATERGFGDYTLLHTACLCHCSKEVIEFLVKQDPLLLQARPFPPLFCAIDHETKMEVLEFLVKSYPDALCSCDVASITPLDMALMEDLPLPIIQLFVSHYPRSELKVSQRAGSFQMHPEVSSIFASEHYVITTLDATNMRFTRQGWITFFKLMSDNGTLEELLLDLGEAEVDPDVCDALNKLMRENDCLQKLSISGRLLPTAFARSIVNGVEKNQTIKELSFLVDLDFMNIEGLLRNCAHHPTLIKLTLRKCVAEGTDWSGLLSLTSLETLDLSDCMVGAGLATPLSALLETTTKLEELQIERNQIGDDGTVLIAHALQKNSTLKRLDYGQNAIGESGWQAFTTALQEHNTTLSSISFGLDDELYETYSQQLMYYCDQNALGRTLSPKQEASRSQFLPSNESNRDTLDEAQETNEGVWQSSVE